MNHWSSFYFGKQYVPNEYDCADLYQEVLKQQFGIDVEFPQHNNVATTADASHLIEKYKYSTGFNPTKDPIEGDLVLMVLGGLYHIGVYYEINGTPFCLHNQAGVGVISERINTRIKIQGYYRWHVLNTAQNH